jgi:alpha-galactosidase
MFFFTGGGSWVFEFPTAFLAAEPPSTQFSFNDQRDASKLKDVTFNGWATWDYYGRTFMTDDVLKNMEQLNKLPVKSNMVQIDGGWWTPRGDSV